VADVVAAHRDKFEIVALVGGTNADALAAMARELKAGFAALADEGQGDALRAALAGSGIACGAGDDAVTDAARMECDLVIAAIVGTAGLFPTFTALAHAPAVALANKECLVSAGHAFMAEAKQRRVAVLPMDSEHNAIHQALAGHAIDDLETMTLTASGGPFRDWDAAAIRAARPEQALAHPNWSMGRKITIDSASLMNKGLELIEAHHLFGVPAAKLDVVVHPQSIVHGLVSFADGAVVAGLACPDMRVPIAHCLAYPERLALGTKRLDLATLGRLDFSAPDEVRFPCLRLARAALAAGGDRPTVMNAANEIAVAAFLDRAISFGGIAELVEIVLERLPQAGAPASVGDALAIDAEARMAARRFVQSRLSAAQ
jgi:1-deoxy-D-xylulose-5-phosphate reductoisomerase